MAPKMKQALLIAGFALLAIAAVAGWTRTPNAPAVNAFTTPAGVYTANQVPPSQSVGYDANGRAVYGQQSGYGQPPVYAQPASYAGNNCVEPMGYQTAAYAPPVYQTRYRTYSRPRVVRTYAQPDRDYVVRRNRRSTGKSVAIVAGSAGVGAAIGALAGGGKGAAIGGLTGGAAGFVYDRLTHNR